MLLGLTIRDVVLIDRLELSFRAGLCVLTGETGAGKSILLDALGLALGVRAESGLVRAGAAPSGARAARRGRHRLRRRYARPAPHRQCRRQEPRLDRRPAARRPGAAG